MIELILGGARSGKSRLAEQRAINSGKELVYIATAQVLDAEMADRVESHRSRRDERWLLVEEPFELAAAVQRYASSERCLLVDCLTLWLSNLLHKECDDRWPLQRQQLLEVLPTLPGELIMVSNEVGMGIVPMGALSRRFVDESGWLHQSLADYCDRVTLTVAGLPMTVKGTAP